MTNNYRISKFEKIATNIAAVIAIPMFFLTIELFVRAILNEPMWPIFR